MRKQELHPRTAILNKKQKNQAKMARHDALRWLTEQFPMAFDNQIMIRPLKLGIMADILQHAERALACGISRCKLREAVVVFTRRIDYLTCLKAREMRIDLDGNPASPVTEEEASHAAAKIKKRVEKSVKNSRKPTTVKSPELINHKSHSSFIAYDSVEASDASNARPAPVLIKHKAARAYDPDAVARLKAKLGLSRQRDVVKEVT